MVSISLSAMVISQRSIRAVLLDLLLFAAATLALTLGAPEVQAQGGSAQEVRSPELARNLRVTAPMSTRRRALVIGNDAYRNVSTLQKAGNDAATMARELRSAGFEVVEHRDLGYREMVKAIDLFADSITGGDQVVFFFAGHGVQIKSGSYLLPVDIEASNEGQVERMAYGLGDLADRLAEAKASFVLLLIDACRDNPLKTRGRSIGNSRGLGAIEPPKGQMIVYSASKGQQALDRLSDTDASPNGVFTREFVKRMRQPGVRVDELVRDVQEAVETLARSVNHEQRPAIYNESRGSFFFYPASVATPTTAAAAAPARSPEQIEDDYWDGIRDSGQPALYAEYLRLYPQGRYAPLAHVMLQRLQAQALPVASVAPAPQSPRPGVAVMAPQPVAASAPQAGVLLDLPAGRVFRDCPECPELVVIPEGRTTRRDRTGRDLPEQEPVVIRSFAIGRTEVTQRQWRALMGNVPSQFGQCGDDCPVERVSWEEVQQFLRKLSEKTGEVYRLPSDLEWDYACSGGGTRPVCEEGEIEQAAWFRLNSNGRPHAVAGKRPNGFGLYDMSGNVRELVDCYMEPPTDGRSWTERECEVARYRGGSWRDEAGRQGGAVNIESRAGYIGFRVARVLQ